MRKKVIVRGPALSASGYGEHTRLVLRSLSTKEALFDIHLENIPWGHTGHAIDIGHESGWIRGMMKKYEEGIEENRAYDISLQVTIPNEFKRLATTNIGITAGIETNKISPEWIQKCNEMDKIITISEHSRKGFIDTKYPLVNEKGEQVSTLECTTPVAVVGYPVKDVLPADIEFNLDTEFNFLSVALWGQRKNLEHTILSFVEAFREDENVGLILKTGFVNGSVRDKSEMKKALKNVSKRIGERKCKLYLLHGRLTESEMTTLLNHEKVKCMLSMAHGEGFGLPLFEAAYNGLPVISTDWGGQLDFLYMPEENKKGKTKNKSMFGKISYELRPVQEGSVWQGVITPDSKWAYPSKQSAITKMRDVYKNHSLAESRAKKLKSFLEEEFSKEKIYEKMTSNILSKQQEELDKDIEDMFSELSL